MAEITYTYRGQIERGTGAPSYAWVDGWSETAPDGGILYPWLTYKECQRDARARGAKARFDYSPRFTGKTTGIQR